MEVEIIRIIKEYSKREGISLILDLKEIRESELEFYEGFLKNPIEVINKFKKYIKEFYPMLILKLKGFDDLIDISSIGIKEIGKLVKIRGLVSKSTKKIALVTSQTFECNVCGSKVTIKGNTKPKTCSCGGKNFQKIEESIQDIREIELEELQEDIKGRQPQKIRIRLVDELAGENYYPLIQPGSKINIIGIIQKIEIENKSDEILYEYRVFAFEVDNEEENFNDSISEEDFTEINEISLNNPLETLSNSLAPNVYGNNDLKKILLLQMVGGVKKIFKDGSQSRDRINLLVIGDPSTSKSELGKAVNIRCPKSYYTSGDNATSVGLTASIEKDELLGSWSVKVGPICKANGSVVIIDEIDKAGKNNLLALHTPLESGYVSIAKAGIDTKIPAESSLLALANPKYGMFEDKDLVEQINLPAPLLSRFDIIYVIRDSLNKEKDDKIVEIIYSGIEEKETIPVELFRKYITYAKTFKPKLDTDFLENLKEFYHETRKQSTSQSSNMRGMPIGVRHLQGIIRMAESSAKLKLNDKVDKEDIELAKKLFYNSLVKIGMNDDGIVDIAKMGGGKSLSKRNLIRSLEEIFKISFGNKPLSDLEIKKIAEEKGFPMNKYYDTIEELNRLGTIIKTKDGWLVY